MINWKEKELTEDNLLSLLDDIKKMSKEDLDIFLNDKTEYGTNILLTLLYDDNYDYIADFINIGMDVNSSNIFGSLFIQSLEFNKLDISKYVIEHKDFKLNEKEIAKISNIFINWYFDEEKIQNIAFINTFLNFYKKNDIRNKINDKEKVKIALELINHPMKNRNGLPLLDLLNEDDFLLASKYLLKHTDMFYGNIYTKEKNCIEGNIYKCKNELMKYVELFFENDKAKNYFSYENMGLFIKNLDEVNNKIKYWLENNDLQKTAMNLAYLKYFEDIYVFNLDLKQNYLEKISAGKNIKKVNFMKFIFNHFRDLSSSFNLYSERMEKEIANEILNNYPILGLCFAPDFLSRKKEDLISNIEVVVSNLVNFFGEGILKNIVLHCEDKKPKYSFLTFVRDGYIKEKILNKDVYELNINFNSEDKIANTAIHETTHIVQFMNNMMNSEDFNNDNWNNILKILFERKEISKDEFCCFVEDIYQKYSNNLMTENIKNKVHEVIQSQDKNFYNSLTAIFEREFPEALSINNYICKNLIKPYFNYLSNTKSYIQNVWENNGKDYYMNNLEIHARLNEMLFNPDGEYDADGINKLEMEKFDVIKPYLIKFNAELGINKLIKNTNINSVRI